MSVLQKIRRKLIPVKPTEERIGWDEFGAEVHPKGKAREVPLKFRQVPSADVAIIRMIQSQLSRQADAAQFDSLEDADDFEVDDDTGDPLSPYEVHELIDEEPMVEEDTRGQKRLRLPPAKQPAARAAGSSDRKSADVSPTSESEGTVPDGKAKA